ncbi:MAG: hypothetical protein GY853_05710, partial [PVC group bacterium]|nr:hypothetical protein [PVC group bacterium]
MKISYKIAIFSMIIALIPMIIVGGSGYFKSKSMLFEKEVKYTEQAVEDIQVRIVEKIDQAKNSAAMLGTSID